jgi:shikimate 5-dehydrogenase
MERAIRAASLDCRCLTLDVSPDELEHAIRGMRAMGFCGAVVAAPHETGAGAYLDALRGAADGQDFVDLIYREEDRLVGQATVGPAIMALVQRSLDLRIDKSPDRKEAADLGHHVKSALVLGDHPRAIAIAHEFMTAGLATTVVQTGSSARTDDSG